MHGRLNVQMRGCCAALLRGFMEVVRPDWVQMFNEFELQTLISGSEAGLDLADLRQHVHYAGAN